MADLTANCLRNLANKDTESESSRQFTHLSLSAPDAVSCRHANGAEAVDGDAKDGIDGAEAGGVVERQPQVAEYLAERPRLLRQDVYGVQGHRDRSCTHTVASRFTAAISETTSFGELLQRSTMRLAKNICKYHGKQRLLTIL